MSVIRSTHFGRLNMLANETNRLSSRMTEASKVAASGLSYTKASDAPGLVGTIHSIREQVQDQEVWTGNAEWGQSLMAIADDAIMNMTDIMASVKEIAMQMSSDYYEVQGMTEAVNEVSGQLDSMVELGNAHLGGRYVFAGAAYDSQAYGDAGVYEGDTDEPEIPVGEGLTVAGGFDGSRLLQGTTDVFQVVNDLITALGTNDSSQVADLLDDIDAAQQQLIGAQAEVGAEMLKAEDAIELSASLGTELRLRLSDLTEADQVESYAKLMQYQTAYEAALQVTASSQVGNLFNKI